MTDPQVLLAVVRRADRLHISGHTEDAVRLLTAALARFNPDTAPPDPDLTAAATAYVALQAIRTSPPGQDDTALAWGRYATTGELGPVTPSTDWFSAADAYATLLTARGATGEAITVRQRILDARQSRGDRAATTMDRLSLITALHRDGQCHLAVTSGLAVLALTQDLPTGTQVHVLVEVVALLAGCGHNDDASTLLAARIDLFGTPGSDTFGAATSFAAWHIAGVEHRHRPVCTQDTSSADRPPLDEDRSRYWWRILNTPRSETPATPHLRIHGPRIEYTGPHPRTVHRSRNGRGYDGLPHRRGAWASTSGGGDDTAPPAPMNVDRRHHPNGRRGCGRPQLVAHMQAGHRPAGPTNSATAHAGIGCAPRPGMPAGYGDARHILPDAAPVGRAERRRARRRAAVTIAATVTLVAVAVAVLVVATRAHPSPSRFPQRYTRTPSAGPAPTPGQAGRPSTGRRSLDVAGLTVHAGAAHAGSADGRTGGTAALSTETRRMLRVERKAFRGRGSVPGAVSAMRPGTTPWSCPADAGHGERGTALTPGAPSSRLHDAPGTTINTVAAARPVDASHRRQYRPGRDGWQAMTRSRDLHQLRHLVTTADHRGSRAQDGTRGCGEPWTPQPTHHHPTRGQRR